MLNAFQLFGSFISWNINIKYIPAYNAVLYLSISYAPTTLSTVDTNHDYLCLGTIKLHGNICDLMISCCNSFSS